MDYSFAHSLVSRISDHRNWFSLSNLCVRRDARDARGSVIAHEPTDAMAAGLRRWIADARGQDTIEYMLLASFIAILGVLGAQAIGIEINTAYRSWDSTTQNVWEVPDPLPTP
jgi:Flp pilus assembly pilin Flp